MIGVFDSGHGGLTVLTAFARRFPDLRFVYLGDHGNAPYGAHDGPAILELTRAGVERLFQAGCRLVILACNSATAVAIRGIQQDWLPHHYPDRRVLGVVVPVVEAITGVPWLYDHSWAKEPRPPATVGVFGTVHTVRSLAYPIEIAKRAPAVTVVQQQCPGLAGAIETGADEGALSALVEDYVGALLAQLDGARLDHVVLGCTHYPLIAPLFARFLPPEAEVLSQPELAAASLADYLRRRPEFAGRGRSPSQPPCRFLTTGDPATVGRIAGRFLGRPIAFEAATEATTAMASPAGAGRLSPCPAGRAAPSSSPSAPPH